MSRSFKIRQEMEKADDIFVESMDGLSFEDLENNILRYTKYLEESEDAKKNCQPIKDKAEELKALQKPYKDKINEYKKKITQLKKFSDENIAKAELEREIIKLAQLAEKQKIEMADDEDVRYCKNELEELRGPFNDTIKILKLKIAYITVLIDEQGRLASE